jgi:hypothetical protein
VGVVNLGQNAKIYIYIYIYIIYIYIYVTEFEKRVLLEQIEVFNFLLLKESLQ